MSLLLSEVLLFLVLVLLLVLHCLQNSVGSLVSSSAVQRHPWTSCSQIAAQLTRAQGYSEWKLLVIAEVVHDGAGRKHYTQDAGMAVARVAVQQYYCQAREAKIYEV